MTGTQKGQGFTPGLWAPNTVFILPPEAASLQALLPLPFVVVVY